MARYIVNAAVTVDAWAFVDADTQDDAREQAVTLSAREFELGDPFNVEVESVHVDD